MRRNVSAAVVVAALASAVVGHGSANAKAERTTRHTFERVWPSAVRFIAVDQGYDILDKDADTGYILFEFDDDDRRFRGSVELIKTRNSQGHDQLRLVVNLVDRPTYMEEVVINRLMQKIRDEHGLPPPPPPPRKKQPRKPADPPPDKDREAEPNRHGR